MFPVFVAPNIPKLNNSHGFRHSKMFDEYVESLCSHRSWRTGSQLTYPSQKFCTKYSNDVGLIANTKIANASLQVQT